MVKTILSISRDQLLLETRAAILRRSGHCVISVRSLADFANALAEQDIHLVVLGHTLPIPEREGVYRLLSEMECPPAVIELYTTTAPPPSPAQFLLAVHDRNFQSDLLALVRQVLSDVAH